MVEGARIGWGASGRNGGQIVNGLNASLQTIGAPVRDTANFVAGLVTEGGDIIRERVATHGIQCDLKPGNVFVALTDAHLRGWRPVCACGAATASTVKEMLGADQMRAHVATDRYVGGMIDRKGGHMHPLNLAWARRRPSKALGGRIFEMSPVTSVGTDAARPALRTARGEIGRGRWFLRQCLSGRRGAGAGKPDHAGLVNHGDRTFGRSGADADARRYLCWGRALYPDCFRMSADGRCCSAAAPSMAAPIPMISKGQALEEHAGRSFRSLPRPRIDYAWSGNFACPSARCRRWAGSARIPISHGYSGHGVTGSPFYASRPRAIHGDATRFDVFAACHGFRSRAGGRSRALFGHGLVVVWAARPAGRFRCGRGRGALPRSMTGLIGMIR